MKGAVEILINRHNIDFVALYAGKVCLRDYVKLEEKGQINKDKITLPYFLQDKRQQKLYQKALNKIASTNHIDLYM